MPQGERFEGVLPPVARGPCFAIRKPAGRVFTLEKPIVDGVGTVKIDDAGNPILDYEITGYLFAGFKQALLRMTEAQFAALESLGCEVIQGFLLGRPVPPEVLATSLLPR